MPVSSDLALFLRQELLLSQLLKYQDYRASTYLEIFFRLSVSEIKHDATVETGLASLPQSGNIVKIDVREDVDKIKLTIERDNSVEKWRQLKQDLSLPLQTIQLDQPVLKFSKHQEIIRTEESARSGSSN